MYRPVNHGYIEVVVGPMYSGKSEELIRRLKRAKIANKIKGKTTQVAIGISRLYPRIFRA